MAPRARFKSLCASAVLTAGLFFEISPAVNETYFRNDIVGAREGAHFGSETPTYFSSIDVKWALLAALVTAFAAMAWNALSILRRDRITSSFGNEVST